jgi:hypothetical protein
MLALFDISGTRLVLQMGVLLCGLVLCCGGLAASGKIAAPSRIPRVENPYCDVATHIFVNLPEQATSLLDRTGTPMIVVNATLASTNALYAKFLMAHECCHHTLGHVRRYYEGLGHLGPQPFYYIRPQLRQMELDADSCAVEILKGADEAEAIETARLIMLGFRNEATGAYYPTGIERAENIARVANR